MKRMEIMSPDPRDGMAVRDGGRDAAGGVQTATGASVWSAARSVWRAAVSASVAEAAIFAPRADARQVREGMAGRGGGRDAAGGVQPATGASVRSDARSVWRADASALVAEAAISAPRADARQVRDGMADRDGGRDAVGGVQTATGASVRSDARSVWRAAVSASVAEAAIPAPRADALHVRDGMADRRAGGSICVRFPRCASLDRCTWRAAAPLLSEDRPRLVRLHLRLAPYCCTAG